MHEDFPYYCRCVWYFSKTTDTTVVLEKYQNIHCRHTTLCVSLKCRFGQHFKEERSLLGRNGAGKTTTNIGACHRELWYEELFKLLIGTLIAANSSYSQKSVADPQLQQSGEGEGNNEEQSQNKTEDISDQLSQYDNVLSQVMSWGDE